MTALDGYVREETSTTVRRVPGEAGIWLFVMADMSVFAVFFALFMYSRGMNRAQFAADHGNLSVAFGTINTVLLLTSSLLVALGVSRADDDRMPGNGRLFAGAAACGLAFVVVKAIEWTHLFGAGLGVRSGEYFSYYFMFNGIHLGHVLIGLTILGRLVYLAGADRPSPASTRFVETGGIFWHMVDLLWVVLFALFYLVR